MSEAGQARDVVVVGASAGGVEALAKLAAALPAGLPAAVFVVLHMAPAGRSALPEILNRAGSLPAVAAQDGMAIRHGRIYVARPNYHLLLEPGRVRVLGGPRENGARPAVDPLFRSAAWAYGERVVGVVLSGTLDDGTAGLRAITRRGGLAVVQSDALFAGMAQSARENTRVDHALPVAEIGALIAKLAVTPATPATPAVGPAPRAEIAARASARSQGDGHMQDQPQARAQGQDALRDQLRDQMSKREGEASGLTCPECNGSLWASDDGLTYECRVDHKYTFDTLLVAKGQEVEAAVWAAINALEERATLLRKSAARVRSRGMSPAEVVRRLDEQAVEAEQQAETIRRTLLGALAAVGDGEREGERFQAEALSLGQVQP